MAHDFSKHFVNRHAIVTGGSSGIGLSLVRRLAAFGAKVSVIALEDADLRRLASQPPPGRHPVLALGADVGDRRELQAAVADCERQSGPCDLLVTSAGVTGPGYFEEIEDGEFERQMRVNYFGTLWAIRAVVPSMKARHTGSIIAISSFAGILGVFGYTAYAPTKFAVRGLCDTLRSELRPHGIHVACVFPPDVDTPLLAAEEPMKPPETRALSGTVKPLSPEAVADAMLRAVATRKRYVFPGRSTPLLARVVSAAPGITDRWTARVVSRAARQPR
ncbi:MAG: SDR family oxidoreductase [Actinomycetota bacterium]